MNCASPEIVFPGRRGSGGIRDECSRAKRIECEKEAACADILFSADSSESVRKDEEEIFFGSAILLMRF